MLAHLQPPKGARKRRKRVGCGPGSGHGKTSTRGHKGAGARAGKEFGPGFEGGQMPLYRRIPKRGFYHLGKTEYEVVNLGQLQGFGANTLVTPELLKEKKIIRKSGAVKILATGEVSVPLTVKAHAFSKKAKELIEKAGGKTEVVS
jgi:large subunit ribosomal protein L15